jgi:hypothetical protein
LLSIILLRVALGILFVSVSVARAIVSVVLARLLVHIISIVIVSAVLLGGVAVALIVRLIIVVILLLRRIAAILSLHRSLLVLVVVCSARSLVGVGLVVSHAARAMAVESGGFAGMLRKGTRRGAAFNGSNGRCTAEKRATRLTLFTAANRTR